MDKTNKIFTIDNLKEIIHNIFSQAETENEVQEMETKMKHIITTQSLLCKNYLEAGIKY